MKKMLLKLWNDEGGFIVTVELILIATILVIGLIAGLVQLRDAVLGELSDTASAFGALSQSYSFSGTNLVNDPNTATGGSAWGDVTETESDSASGSDSLTAAISVVVSPTSDETGGVPTF